MKMKVVRIESASASVEGKKRITLRVERPDSKQSPVWWPEITLHEDEINKFDLVLDQVLGVNFVFPIASYDEYPGLIPESAERNGEL